jgi:hypothetical protein
MKGGEIEKIRISMQSLYNEVRGSGNDGDDDEMYSPSGIMSLISLIACLSFICILVSALTANRLLCRANNDVRPLMQACTSSLSVDRRAPLRNMRRSRRPPAQRDKVGLGSEEGKKGINE